MTQKLEHVCVCICTFRRLQMLKRLLDELSVQETKGLFTYSVLVADNDRIESARPIVAAFNADNAMRVQYCVEPVQNIAAVRNRAVQQATGDYIAFIDDDEYPVREWLLILYKTLHEHKVDGVLGPVKPDYEVMPPDWVAKGKFYDRPSYPTGFVIDWPKGRTGNVLFCRRIFDGVEQPFRRDFLTGEDQDFFRRMIEMGHVFIWCDEALAYETVPAARWKLSFMLRRALLRGQVSLRHPTFGMGELAKSVVAIPTYTIALPFLLFAGQHVFISYLVRTFDHLGRVLAFLGIKLLKEQYVTE